LRRVVEAWPLLTAAARRRLAELCEQIATRGRQGVE
jgi:hypothetical protein